MEAGNISPTTLVVDAGALNQSRELAAAGAVEPRETSQSASAYYMTLSQTRLVIEMDAVSGGWVYKTLDAKNGQVVAQYPLRSAWEIILSQRSGLGLVVNARA
jgi:hypothetical protein